MRQRAEISEAEMVPVFLRAEIASERFGARLLELLRVMDEIVGSRSFPTQIGPLRTHS